MQKMRRQLKKMRPKNKDAEAINLKDKDAERSAIKDKDRQDGHAVLLIKHDHVDPLECSLVSDFRRLALVCKQELPRSHGGSPSPNLGRTRHLAWDFAEFDRHINALARGLLGMGIEKGDRVTVIMGNNSLYAMLQCATCSIGAILVMLNPAYSASRRIAPPGNIQELTLPNLRNLVVVDNQETYKDHLQKLGVKSIVDWRDVMLWGEDSEISGQGRHNQSTVHKAKLDPIYGLSLGTWPLGSGEVWWFTHRPTSI
ncbi:hypothetical protein C8J56DRAFT_1100602 [Mycena floridula]|nr:hypothetical protein C8J56DRAFT_1100602 [Mycena floridula]